MVADAVVSSLVAFHHGKRVHIGLARTQAAKAERPGGGADPVFGQTMTSKTFGNEGRRAGVYLSSTSRFWSYESGCRTTTCGANGRSDALGDLVSLAEG